MSAAALPVVVGVVYEAYQADNLLLLGRALLERGVCRLVLVSPYHLPYTDRYRQQCADAGLLYVAESTAEGGDAPIAPQLGLQEEAASAQAPAGPDEAAARSGGPRPGPRRRWALARAVRRMEGLPPEHPLRLQHEEWLRWYAERGRRTGRILDLAEARGVLFAEHNVERDSAVWVRQARERGLPSLVVTSSAISAVEAAETYADSPEHRLAAPGGRDLVAVRRTWLFEHRGRQHVRLPAARALAAERLGLAPPLPWLLNSGEVDVVALESERQRRQYLGLGFRRDQLRVTGSPMLDTLAAAQRAAPQRRTELQRDHGLPAGPLVVTALPPDQWPARPAAGFADHAALATAWVDALARLPGWSVCVSPHPSMRDHDLSWLERERVAVLPLPVAELIPLAALYVATASSTMKWARACGKPVVDFDAYGYGYDDFAGDAAVTVVRRYEDLLAVLDERRTAPAEPGRAVEDDDWGVLDGQAVARTCTLVQDLLARRAGAR